MAAGRPRLCRPSACMRRCLERTFEEPPGSLARSGISVVPHSAMSRLHFGYATTRRDRLYLPRGCDEFWSSPAWVLHEYYHLLRQWRPGTLTTPKYVAAALRHPLRPHESNAFEKEAEAFVAAKLDAFVACLRRAERGTAPSVT